MASLPVFVSLRGGLAPSKGIKRPRTSASGSPASKRRRTDDLPATKRPVAQAQVPPEALMMEMLFSNARAHFKAMLQQ